VRRAEVLLDHAHAAEVRAVREEAATTEREGAAT